MAADGGGGDGGGAAANTEGTHHRLCTDTPTCQPTPHTPPTPHTLMTAPSAAAVQQSPVASPPFAPAAARMPHARLRAPPAPHASQQRGGTAVRWRRVGAAARTGGGPAAQAVADADASASVSVSAAAGSDVSDALPAPPRRQPGRKRFARRRKPVAAAGATADSTESVAAGTTASSSSPPSPPSLSDLGLDLSDGLRRGTYECMICCERIRLQAARWSCSRCFAVFHFACIRRWSKVSTDEAPAPAAVQLPPSLSPSASAAAVALLRVAAVVPPSGVARGGRGACAPWRCPGCQLVHRSEPKARCFCGKVVLNPRAGGTDHFLVPGSCGEPCGKRLVPAAGAAGASAGAAGASSAGGGLAVTTECPHRCVMQCHPGPCPPCTAAGRQEPCFCGRETMNLRCGESGRGRSCGRVCGRPLSCGTHTCETPCHPGDCAPCARTEEHACHCARSARALPCGTDSFSCGAVCRRPLSCGHHTCERACHTGACGPCPLRPGAVSTCPCGKIPVVLLAPDRRTRCTDPVPTCPNTCGRVLPACGHRCAAPCHPGACPLCTARVVCQCLCGATSTEHACSEAGTLRRCTRKCRAHLTCGRHRCGRVCCPASLRGDPTQEDPNGVHVCPEPCGRALPCRRHTCEFPCHRGRCPPCPEPVLDEVYVCECGKTRLDPPFACGAPRPACPHPCARARACDHAADHTCHMRTAPCPPCEVATEKPCPGRHVTRMVPCTLETRPCGRRCDRTLVCGVHRCQRLCHTGACAEPCAQLCMALRRPCGHPCTQPCHGRAPCPATPLCATKVPATCPCGFRAAQLECLGRTSPELLCDDQCAVAARNRQLAVALGVADRFAYSDFLLQIAHTFPAFVRLAEQEFDALLRNPDRERHAFSSMKREMRRALHEIAALYGLDSEAVHAEPFRHIVVTKRPNSKPPPYLLSAAAAVARRRLELPPGAGTACSSSSAAAAAADDDNDATEPASRAPMFSIEITGFDGAARMPQLQAFIRPFAFDCVLKLIEPHRAIAVFRNEQVMRTALYVLSGGAFTVRECAYAGGESFSAQHGGSGWGAAAVTDAGKRNGDGEDQKEGRTRVRQGGWWDDGGAASRGVGVGAGGGGGEDVDGWTTVSPRAGPARQFVVENWEDLLDDSSGDGEGDGDGGGGGESAGVGAGGCLAPPTDHPGAGEGGEPTTEGKEKLDAEGDGEEQVLDKPEEKEEASTGPAEPGSDD